MNKQLTGAAGVFYVASELSMRGMVAIPTIRNVAGADILVSDPEGKHFAFIQVKTSKSKVTFWPLGNNFRDWVGENCYYVFVRRVGDRFEAFLEKADIIARETEICHQISVKKGDKKWAVCWPISGKWATKDAQERTRHNWENFRVNPE